MSILWIYHSPILPTAGGTERASISVMSALQEAGTPVAGSLVFTQDHPRQILDESGAQISDLKDFLTRKGVSVVVNQIGYSDWLLEEFLIRGGGDWRQSGGKVITCLHFSPEMFQESLSELLLHWSDKTTLQKIRRAIRILLLPISRMKAKRRLIASYRYLLRESDKFILLSQAHRGLLEKMTYGEPHEKIEVIPNPNTYSQSARSESVSRKKKQALVVARLDEGQKRVSLALRAWQKVMSLGGADDWRLIIIGEGVWRPHYEQLAAKLSLFNVDFEGRRDPEQYYEQSAIYLHTAKKEGWGLTITEAMQKGVVPVVMNSSGVFKELIESGANGCLVKDGDTWAMAQQISRLINSTEERMELGKAALNGTQRFDRRNIASAWSALLRDIS